MTATAGWILYLVLLPAVIVGVFFTWRGWRGRRVGDHPHCGACGFDLFGGPDDGRKCPECGADVNVAEGRQIVIGRRVRDTKRLAIGLTLAALAGVPAAGLVWSSMHQASWQKFKPTAVLLWEAESTGNAGDAALGELLRRDTAGALSTEQRLRLLRGELARQQARGPGWWNHKTTPVVVDLQAKGQLPKELLDQFVGQRWVPTMIVRPAVRGGDPLPIELRVTQYLGSGGTIGQHPDLPDLLTVTIDGRPVTVTLPPPPERGEWPAGTMHLDVNPLGLVPGEHRLSLTMQYDVFGPNAPVLPKRKQTTTLSGTFRLLPPGEDSIGAFDEVAGAAVQQHTTITIARLLKDGKAGFYYSSWWRPPSGRVALAHHVSVRGADGIERPLGFIAGEWPTPKLQFNLHLNPADLGSADANALDGGTPIALDVILSPDAESARQTATGTAVAGRIVFTGVTARP